MHILGIETSCDETAAAIVARRADAPDGPGRILANRVLRQEAHAAYGGVVPELAARAHVEHLDRLVGEALAEAGLRLNQLDGIAATAGPGLVGGLMVGMTTAKALALAADKPFIGVNHLEAHALTIRLTHGLAFPYLMLLISGGHCQLAAIHGVGRAALYGTTRDDAVGEVLDKAAMMLGLGWPGGAAVEQAARRVRPADAARVPRLPRPLCGAPGMEFSFSGLKTALARALARDPAPSVPHYAQALQAAIADCLCDRTRAACERFAAEQGQAGQGQSEQSAPYRLVAAGGVAANQTIRAALKRTARAAGFELFLVPPALCTDNGTMIAWAAAEQLARHGGQGGAQGGAYRDGGQDWGQDWKMAARPRWPMRSAAKI